MVVSDEEINARRHKLTKKADKMGGKSSKPTATSSDSSFESGSGSGKDGSGSGDTFIPLKKDKHNDPSQTETTVEVEERDEILEIRKQSSKETTRVRIWRVLVTLALLATAVAVTATTYILLVNQEDENFRNVVSV